VAADPRLEDGLGDRRGEQVVLRRLEVAESLGEHAEGAGDRGGDEDVLADDGGLGLGHVSSSVGLSTASA